MAKNTGRGSRVASGLIKPVGNGIWSRRENESRGQFIDAKTHGGTFKGVTDPAARGTR